MVSSIKLPSLKKGEYILWTMKIEQYLAHTDYALWEAILNGNSIVQMTKDEAGNEVEVPPVSAQQILPRTRERKDKSTLLMAIPDEHLARFHGIKDAKILWVAIKTRFDESTSNTIDLNVAYSVSTVTGHGLMHKKTRRKLEFNEKEPIDFDKTKVECFNWHRRGHFTRDCRIAKNSGNKSRDARNAGYRGRDNGKRPTREEDEKALLDEALREKEELKAKLKKFETSLKNLTKLLDIQISAKVKNGLGYDSQFNEKEVLDVKEKEVTKNVFDNRSSDEENSLANDRFKKGEGYHEVPPPLTMNYMPPKSDLSFTGLDESIYKFKISETVTNLTKDEKDALQTIFTRSRRILVSAAKPKAAASTSAPKPVNTVRPKKSVNFSKSRSTFHKSNSSIRRSFYNATTHSRRNSTERVNTAGSKAVSVVKGNGVTGVKTSTGCVWRPRVNEIDQISKENRLIYTRVDYGHPQQALKNKEIVDSGALGT
nr:ribonuclease H-like domain-containing protein [Tanacetum cinerariifolium]